MTPASFRLFLAIPLLFASRLFPEDSQTIRLVSNVTLHRGALLPIDGFGMNGLDLSHMPKDEIARGAQRAAQYVFSRNVKLAYDSRWIKASNTFSNTIAYRMAPSKTKTVFWSGLLCELSGAIALTNEILVNEFHFSKTYDRFPDLADPSQARLLVKEINTAATAALLGQIQDSMAISREIAFKIFAKRSQIDPKNRLFSTLIRYQMDMAECR